MKIAAVAATINSKLAFAARPRCGDAEKETLKILIFQDKFDILWEMRFSGVDGQGYTMLYEKPYVMLKVKQWFLANADQEVNDHEN